MGICRMVQHHFVQSSVPLPCCHPGSAVLTVLHVTTRHFTSLMLLIFSSSSSFFTRGWKYCSCSSASACGSPQKGLWGDKDRRIHFINVLRANDYWACRLGARETPNNLLLQKPHVVYVLQFTNTEMGHPWGVQVGGLTAAWTVLKKAHTSRESAGRGQVGKCHDWNWFLAKMLCLRRA